MPTAEADEGGDTADRHASQDDGDDDFHSVDELTSMSLEELMETMTKRARGMQADKIRNEDVARSGGAPEATE